MILQKNNAHGHLIGSGYFNGNFLTLNGGYLDIPSLNITTGDFTISCSINSSTNSRNPIVADWRYPWSYMIIFESGHISVSLRKNINSSGSNPDQDLINMTSQGYVIPTNTWVHVSVTWSCVRKTCIIYLNGSFNSSASTNCADVLQRSGHNSHFIGFKEDSNQTFQGSLKQFTFYERVLQPYEIQALAQKCL